MIRTLRAYVTVGVALVGVGVITVTPVTPPLPDVHVPDIQLTASDEDIVIDFVRHGNTALNTADPGGVAGNGLPGFPLSDLGQQEAQDVGNQLFNQLGGPDGVAGIFAGQNVRSLETAAPFATLEDMQTQILPGLNEVSGGIYAGSPLSGPGGILYELTVFAWALGFPSVPLPGSNAFNGVVFEESFNNAVQTDVQRRCG